MFSRWLNENYLHWNTNPWDVSDMTSYYVGMDIAIFVYFSVIALLIYGMVYEFKRPHADDKKAKRGRK